MRMRWLLVLGVLLVGGGALGSAQVGNMLGGRGGDLFTTRFLVVSGNGVSPSFDTTGLLNIPRSWRSSALAVVIGSAPANGAALRGYTNLENRTGYLQRFDFYLAAEAMEAETFCSIAVGKGISALDFDDGSVPIAYYIKIAKTSGQRRIQVDIPTDTGSQTFTWSGTVGLQTVYRFETEYNIRESHHTFSVNGDTVLDRDFDGSAVESIGTLVLGSSGGSTCRNVIYLIGRTLESPVLPEPFIPPPPVPVAPTKAVISGGSIANGATSVPLVGQSLGCFSASALTYDILFGTTNPPTTALTLSNTSACSYSLTGLQNATTYYWRANATNAGGTTTGDVWSFTTVAAPTNGDLDLVAASAGCPDGNDDSPTGRNPRLLWTCARQEAWNQMVADYEAAGCSALMSAGTCAATPATRGGRAFKQARALAFVPWVSGNTNYGQWNAWMYQMTGDAEYITHPTLGMWKKVTDRLINTAPPRDPNFARVVMGMYTLMLEWSWPALSEQQRLDFVAEIDQENDDGWWRYGGGKGRVGDSDQTLGQWYFPAAMMKAILPNNVSNNAIWDDPDMGGFTSTNCTTLPVTPETLRNGVCAMFALAGSGGEYLEGPMYAKETLPYTVMAQAVSDARGVDTYPEITTWLASASQLHRLNFTPDLQKQIQFMDEQDPNILVKYRVGEVLAALSGLLQGTDEGDKAHQLLIDMATEHGESTIGPSTKWWGWFVYNPYADVADWKTDKFHEASGMGTQYLKSGFTDSDSLYVNFCNPFPFFTNSYGTQVWDHKPWHGCAPQLYKNGEWIVSFIASYAGASNMGEGNNTMRYNGFGHVFEYSQIRSKSLADTHAFTASVMGGAQVRSTHTGLGKPPVFLNEGSRATLHVPGAVSTIIIHDRASVDDITADSTDLNRYTAIDCSESGRNHITQKHAKQEWIWHIPVDPTVAGGVFTWTTPVTSQAAKLTSLLPAAATRTVYDLATTFAQNLATGHRCGWHNTQINPPGAPVDGAPYYEADGGGYNRKLLKIWPETMGTFHTYLNVFQVGATTPATPTLITNSNAECAHVVTSGQNDILACFNGATSTVLSNTAYDIAHKAILDSARLRGAGSFTVAYTASATTTELYLADLNSNGVSWAYTVDGGASTPIADATLDASGGFIRISLSLAAGAHTIVVTGS